MDTVVLDPKGKWYRLDSPFPFHDPESDALFRPGVATKATPTERVKSNPRLKEIEDPTEVAVKKLAVKPTKVD